MEGTPYTYDELQGFAEFIKQKTAHRPTIGIIAGSGQGALASMVEDEIIITYRDIPNFPISTVAGHKGQFVIGNLKGKSVLVMSGRFHSYEGYPPYKLVAPIRVMSLLGIKTLIVCNAAGGINRDFKVGDFMLMKDHIGFPILAGQNPLRGPNDERFGPRFLNMSDVYSLRLRKLAHSVAKDEGLSHFIREGVYLMASGPSYETPAELRFFRTIGADVVGMSTVPEAIAARHCGMEVLGMSMVTNACIMENDIEQKTDHQEVLETGKRQGESMCKLISKIVEKMDHKEQNGA
ncbi:purine nucleoside phosphorylase 1-like [Apostichopus japonicus]|uniref:purine nucleoside phosphorylase 1-like n=1 Tax=Stichopus japonicus TaxID=307972 RepID=UPI003AB1E541